MTWGIRGYSPAILDTGAASVLVLLPVNYCWLMKGVNLENVVPLCALIGRTVDKDRGFLLLAIFMLCFPTGPKAVSGGCTCCRTLHSAQYRSCSSEGAQLSLQVQQRHK